MPRIKHLLCALLLLAAPPAMEAQDLYEAMTLATGQLHGTSRHVATAGALEVLGSDISAINGNPAALAGTASHYFCLSAGPAWLGGEKDVFYTSRLHLSLEQAGLSYRLNPYRPDRASCLTLGFQYRKDHNFNQSLIHQDNASTYRRGQKGYIGYVDFSLAWERNARLSVGITLSFSDVHYYEHNQYAASDNTLFMAQSRRIGGNGIDMHLGLRARPVARVPWMVGAWFGSPTYFKLTSRTKQANDAETNPSDMEPVYCDYDLLTPIAWGVQNGFYGKRWSAGLAFDITHYTSMRLRQVVEYDDHDLSHSVTDAASKEQILQQLRPTCTLRLGCEWIVRPRLSVSCGYNLVSSPYSNNVEIANTFTHRATCGVGYSYNRFTADLAYLFNYSPTAVSSTYDNNIETANQKIVNTFTQRLHQLQLTLGVKF